LKKGNFTWLLFRTPTHLPRRQSTPPVDYACRLRLSTTPVDYACRLRLSTAPVYYLGTTCLVRLSAAVGRLPTLVRLSTTPVVCYAWLLRLSTPPVYNACLSACRLRLSTITSLSSTPAYYACLVRLSCRHSTRYWSTVVEYSSDYYEGSLLKCNNRRWRYNPGTRCCCCWWCCCRPAANEG
jgi:hypothetical protein